MTGAGRQARSGSAACRRDGAGDRGEDRIRLGNQGGDVETEAIAFGHQLEVEEGAAPRLANGKLDNRVVQGGPEPEPHSTGDALALPPVEQCSPRGKAVGGSRLLEGARDLEASMPETNGRHTEQDKS